MYVETHYFCQTALSSRHEWEKRQKSWEVVVVQTRNRGGDEEMLKGNKPNNKKEEEKYGKKISLSCLITQQRPGELCVEHGSRASNSNLLKKKAKRQDTSLKTFIFCVVLLFLLPCALLLCVSPSTSSRARSLVVGGVWPVVEIRPESREWADNDDVFFFGRKRMLFTHFSFHLVVVVFSFVCIAPTCYVSSMLSSTSRWMGRPRAWLGYSQSRTRNTVCLSGLLLLWLIKLVYILSRPSRGHQSEKKSEIL